MRKLFAVMIGMTLISFAFADDVQPTDVAPKTQVKSGANKKVDNQAAANFSFDKMQQQLLASQEARLPLVDKEIQLRYVAPLKVLSDPDTSAVLARYIHSLYENLVKEGFTKDEALQIASRVPFPPALSGPPY